MWLVNKLVPFEIEQTGPYILPIPIQFDPGKMIGYLPAYETLEDAKADYPEGPFSEVRFLNLPEPQEPETGSS